MKKSVKRIALSFLIAVMAIVCCVIGANAFRGDRKIIASAATATTAIIVSDKDTVGPGETFTITLKITSTYSDAQWSSFSFVFGEIDELGKGTDTNAEYLSLVSFTHNLKGTWLDTSSYKSTASSPSKVGMNVGLSFDASSAIKAMTSDPVELKFTLKVSESAGSIGKLVFGIGSAATNKLNFIPNGGISTAETFKAIAPNTLEIKLGTISHDADLKSLNVGHGTPSDSITVAESMTYTSMSDNTANFKVKPVTDSSATILYGSAATNPTPNQSVTSGTELTIPLESGGVTVIKFKITAEDGTTTKDYVLTVTSGYARLNALTIAQVGGTSVNNAVDPAFVKDGTAYTVKVASDYTSVELTPQILAGYGATGGAVTATGCSASATAVTSSGKITVTNITNNATVALSVVAKDGTTTQTYTLTFNVLDADASISSISMTEDVTGNSVSNDAGKATANSVQYYFELSEESGGMGTLSITTGSSSATVTVDGAAYSATQKYGEGTKTVVVTAQTGKTATYKVMIKKKVSAGEIKNIEYKVGTGSFSSVTTDGDVTYDASTNTYTLTKTLDPAVYPVGTQFTVQGTATSGASVTFTGGISGSGPWTKSLTAKNSFGIKVTTSQGSTTYNFVINIEEGKNGITNLVIKDRAGNVFSGFSFDPGTTYYNITVPYKDYDYVKFDATTDGALANVKVEVSGRTPATFTRGTDGYSHTYAGGQTTTNLSTANATTFVIYAVADNANKGTEYTVDITRTAADTNARLDSLTVTVDGNVISDFDGVYFDPETFAYTYTMTEKVTPGSTTATVNIAATASGAGTVTAGSGTTLGDNTYNYAASKTYTITVKSEGNTTQNYTVTVKYAPPGADFTDIEISTDGSSFTSVIGDFGGDDGSLQSKPKTYSVNYTFDDAKPGDKFYVRVALNSPDATAKNSGVSGTTTLTLTGDTFEGALKYGTNKFAFHAESAGGKTYYAITVDLKEGCNGITDIALTPTGGTIDASEFTFDAYQYSYDINVGFNVANVTIAITPEGLQYEKIYELGVANALGNKSGAAYRIMSRALAMGDTTTIVVYGMSDTGEKGDEYTLNFIKAAANSDTLLDDLTVTIGGQPIDIQFTPGTTSYTIEVPADLLESNPTSLPVVITATPQSADATVTGTGNKTFSINKTTPSTQTYTVMVKAQDGSELPYTIIVNRSIEEGDFKTLQFAQTPSNYEEVLTSSYYDSASKTYTLTLNPDTYPAGTKVYVMAVPTSGASVTVKPALSGSSNVYTITLAQGENKYEFTSASSTGSNTCTFVINLFEDKNTIEDIVLTTDKLTATEIAELFTFSQFTEDYTINLPSTVNAFKLTVKTDGVFCKVEDDNKNVFAKPASDTTKRNHEKSVTIKEGETLVFVLHAVSDRGESGKDYTLIITREAPNSDTTLKKLEVSIGGQPYDFSEGAFDPATKNYSVQVPEGMSSGAVKIMAEANAPTSTVSGDGTKSFVLGDSTATQTYEITVTAEDGSTGVYTLTVSQKPLVLDSTYSLLNITITAPGYPNLFNGLPDYYNNPEYLNVDNKTTSVNIVVTAESSTSEVFIETSPNELNNGMLRLEEGDNVVRIYAVAQDGTNKGGIDYYEFIIKRAKLYTGPDTTITMGEEDEFAFILSDDSQLVYVLQPYSYDYAKLEINAVLLNGGLYSVTRIEQGEDSAEPELKEIFKEIPSGTTKKLPLNYGVNVFSVKVESLDGRVTKNVVFVIERSAAALEGLSANEIPALKNDFDADINEYTYSVKSSVKTVNLNVDYDKDLLTYKIDGPAELSYGMNKIVVTIYEKSSGRATASGEAIRTITLNVFRERDTSFWLILSCVLIALAVAMLIIIILVAKRGKRPPEEPAIIVTPSGPQQLPPPQQQPTVVIQNPNDYNGYGY